MEFLQPLYFWLFLLLLILIVFYLFKQTFEKQYISSTFLWDEALKNRDSNRWWFRFINNLLFYIQALIIILIILALAGPFSLSEKDKQHHYVFILDSSASMEVSAGSHSRFIEAKDEIKEKLNGLSGREFVSLIVAKDEPEIVIAQETNHKKVEDFLENVNVTYQKANIDESILLAESLIGNQGDIYVYSDFYKKPEDMNLLLPLTVDNLASEPNNISLHSFGVRRKGEKAEAVVTIKSFLTDSERKVTISLEHEGKELMKREITIKPGEEKVIDFMDLPLEPYYQAKIVEQDDFILDNNQFALMDDSSSSLKVQIIGEVNWFYVKALQSIGAEVIHSSTQEVDGNGKTVFLVGDTPVEEWPNGPKIIVNPVEGGPFNISEKLVLTQPIKGSKESDVLEYVDLQDIYMLKAFSIQNQEQLTPIIRSGENPILSKGIYEQHPFYLFSFDLKDSDWPLHASFPILMQNILFDFKSNVLRTSIGYFSPGEIRSLPFSVDSETFSVRNVEGTRMLDSYSEFNSIKVPFEPGLYQAEWNEEGKVVNKNFVVQADSNESVMAKQESFSINDSVEEPLKEDVIESYWRWFAILAFFLLLVELEVVRYRYTN